MADNRYCWLVCPLADGLGWTLGCGASGCVVVGVLVCRNVVMVWLSVHGKSWCGYGVVMVLL